MKKLIVFFIFLFIPVTALATTVVYRTSSGEVANISTANNPFVEYSLTYFTVVTDPTLVDGTDIDFRTLGMSKIYDNGTVRNATQQEIDGFAAYALADRNAKQAQQATDYLDNDPKFRRAVMAIIKGIVREDNELRNWMRDFKDLVANSTSLADFKSRVAAEPDMVNREVADAKTYIKNQISADD